MSDTELKLDYKISELRALQKEALECRTLGVQTDCEDNIIEVAKDLRELLHPLNMELTQIIGFNLI